MAAGAGLRALRAAVFTAVCVALSAGGHVFGGGGPVSLLALAAGFAVVFAVSTALAGRERSLPGIVGLTAFGQLGLHSLFALGGGHHPPPRSGALETAQRLLCHEQVGHQLSEAQAQHLVRQAGLQVAPSSVHAAHNAVLDGALTPLECLRSAARVAFTAFDVPMLLGHLVVALLVGWLLRRGEAALWRLARLPAQAACVADEVLALRALRAAVCYVRALQAGLPRPVVVRGGCPTARRRPLRSALVAHCVPARGPPADELTLAA